MLSALPQHSCAHSRMYFGLSDLTLGGHDEAGYSREKGAEYRLFIDQFRSVENMFSPLASKAVDLRLRHQGG